MQITERTRKITISILLMVIFLTVVVTMYLGAKQDEGYNIDYNRFLSAESTEIQYPANAEQIFRQLLATHSDSYILMWDLADVLADQNKYAAAAKYYTEARRQRPVLVADQQYLLAYATTLYHLGQFKLAKQFLVHAVPNEYSANNDPSTTQKVKQLLQQINFSLKNTNGREKQ